MNKLTRITCAAAIALTGASSFALAQGNIDGAGAENGRGHGRGRGGRMMHALQQVGVNDQQKEQIKSILRESRPAMQPLVQQLRQERRALRDAIQASPVNEAAIRAASGRVAQIQADLAVQRARVGERVRAVLTPDQVAKLKEMQSKWDAKRDEWMNRRRGGGNGPGA